MSRSTGFRLACFAMVFAAALPTLSAGCGLFGDLTPAPFGSITAVQLFEEPNYTMALSVETAVINPDAIAKVNWVFGDGGGFVEGATNQATISHRYLAPGDYVVTAYLFGAEGFVDQVDGTITVEPDDSDVPPDGELPEDLPGTVSGPSPANGATNVAVDAVLTWLPDLLAESHDVYLGTDETTVAEATRDDAAIYRGNQTDATFDPEGLEPETEYFWRIDEVNALGATNGTVFSFTTAAAPEKAKSPFPATGSMSARVDQVLTWTAGEGATSHDVYFGKDMAAVADATDEDETVFQGNQSAASIDPEDEDAEEEGELLADTMYFWRIDEVGPGGTTKGDVWSFRTRPAPPKIMPPISPADGAVGVNVEPVLSWTSAAGIESFDVFFGEDFADVESATRDSGPFEGNQTATNFSPGVLAGATSYFWRVDTRGAGGTTKGDVFGFTTAEPPGQVVGPFTPADNATNVDIQSDLSWNVGGGGQTDGFVIYLSTSFSAVLNGAASARVGMQGVGVTTFETLGLLDPSMTYFWRIDATGPGGSTPGPVLRFTTGDPPPAVTNPNPSNGALGVALDVTLQWSAAAGATSYDVYFGDDQSAVESAGETDAELRANVVGTSFMPGSVFPEGELEGNREYFWRIDSKGAGGAAAGPVWSFTTAPARASEPSPSDMEDGVGLDAVLSWTAGLGASSHNVYLGTDESAVESATPGSAGIFRGNQTSTSFDPPGLLAGDTVYYWRIDEVSVNGTTKGLVWSFDTGPGSAAEPISPFDGQIRVDLLPTLMWSAGAGAAFHDIYLGTNEVAVESATRASPEFQGTQPIGSESFVPDGELDGFTFYFWRIDEITAADVVTPGEVWQFRTKPGRATNPSPAHFAVDVSVETLLEWTPAAGAFLHDVYFGTSQTAVAGASIADPMGVFQETTADDMFDPGTLNGATTYFWRIDTVASDGMTRTTGEVWRFTTLAAPGLAGPPTPANNATNISTDIVLNWGPATGAETYDIYFGTDAMAVAGADPSDPEFQGNQAIRNYDPGGLAGGTIYYWRIDAVNEAGTTAGTVWQFTTQP